MNLYFEKIGNGPTVVLLHGMAGSGRYWRSWVESLSTEYTLVTVDLLGFGRSPKPTGTGYTLGDHVEAVIKTLKAAGVHEYILIGHSMGAQIALGIAEQRPAAVKKMVLFGIPVFAGYMQMRQAITKGTKARELLYFGNSSRAFCTLWCQWMRPITSLIAPLYIKHMLGDRLSAASARDSLRHTWQSYHESLVNVVADTSVSKRIENVGVETLIVMGAEDAIVKKNIAQLKLNSMTQLIQRDGSHNLPLEIDPGGFAEQYLAD